jgi:hypothetical protein
MMRNIQKWFYFLWKKASEKRMRFHYSDYFKEAINRYEQCAEKKSVRQIKKEMNQLQKYWGCYPYQYYRYDMYRKDCPLTMSEMQKYVPLYFAFYLLYPKMYKKYGILCNDKALTAALLNSYRLGQPELLYLYEQNTFFDKNNGITTDKHIEEIISKLTCSKVFVKPCFGVGGQGIIVFHKKKDGIYMNDTQHILGSKYFFQNIDNQKYIIQAGVEQGDEINKIYPGSVNTFRIFTEYNSGDAKILLSMLRIGQGGKQVDNYSSGGITIKVDPQTGILDGFAYGFQRSHIYQHPDTGFQFAGYQLQCWPEIVSFVLKCAEKFREIRILGWDIAYSATGPVVVEINEGPSVEAIQDCYGGIHDILPIDNPKIWWKSDEFVLSER